MKRAYLNWSGGKDSALALYAALRSGEYRVEALFSAVQAGRGEVAMHGTGVSLLARQAEAAGLPLIPFYFDPEWPEARYRAEMGEAVGRLREAGIDTALFGDLYLEPLRRSREERCARAGIRAEFPLWGTPPERAMEELLRLGFRTVVTCVDCAVLPERLLGRVIDGAFAAEIPPGADLCGERGEYHSFVFDGPVFRRPAPYEAGETYGSGRYRYLELR